MVNSILSKILFALQILSLEWKREDQLSVLGQAPDWAKTEFDCFNSSSTFAAQAFSPFLENFLIDAQDFWQECPRSFLRSGLWTETGCCGKEVRLEAVALYLEGRCIILIESSDSKYSERFQWLQTARQERLNFISERKIAEAKILGAKFYDALTGLPNQTFFLAQLTSCLEQSQRDYQKQNYHAQIAQHQSAQHQIAVLVINLDRFQVLNNSLGYAMGDQLLRAVAERIKGCLRQDDLLVRLGSDEFGILLQGVEQEQDAIAIARRITADLRKRFVLTQPQDGSHETLITASVGVALSEFERYGTPRELLRDAGIAMHQAKALDRGHYVLFERKMHTRAFALWQLESDLHRALEAGELQVWYQPIVSLQTHRVASFEALLRWHHPEKGWISPHKFVPLAEETGFILKLDAWTLEEACRTIHQWDTIAQQSSLGIAQPSLILNVNLSSRHLGEVDLLQRVQRTLDKTEAKPHQLNLEITESFLLTDPKTAIARLQQLRQRGFKISIDDFGTGYASLSYLQDLPVDKLKIDGHFIDMMLESGTEIVSTIIQLAHNLKIDVTAERVETPEQYQMLKTLGCDYAQGYLMAKPMPPHEAIALIHKDFRGCLS